MRGDTSVRKNGAQLVDIFEGVQGKLYTAIQWVKIASTSTDLLASSPWDWAV